MAVYNEKNKNKWTKDGRHYYYKCYYTDMYGNRKQKVSKMFLTSSEAKNAEREFLTTVSKKDISDISISFADVYNGWLIYKKSFIKSSTFYSRKLTANKYILSYFKDYKLHSIKINIITKWNNYILGLTNIGLDEKNRIISIMKEILEYAENNYDFDRKVTSKIIKQKVEKSSDTRDSEKNFWTYEEFQKFIEVVDNDVYYLMFNFLYYTGLRFGEFNALNWNDINFERKTISINKTLTTKFEKKDFKPMIEEANKKKLKVIEGKDYIITDPKTKNSFRIVNLDDQLIMLLQKHKEIEEKIYGFNNNFFIFGNVRFFAKTTFRRKLEEYINNAKVKKITPHGFRHSHVSLLIYLGCDVYEVAERIGDTPTEVERTYYHMFPDKKKHTIDVINKLKK
ncbi:MAG: site-specific integrase [Bacilli bacterium]|nr:site-specific integrase [Bacilli bacterium]